MGVTSKLTLGKISKFTSLLLCYCCRLQSLFPTCQIRVVRFYVSLISSSSSFSPSSSSYLNHDHPHPVFPARPQPRPSTPSVPSRTSTTTIHAPCSCTAGPQPRPSTPSVPCRASTTTIHAQCSLPNLNHDHPHHGRRSRKWSSARMAWALLPRQSQV